jgi:NAD(P)-dependent dehydrogenase (short-subunit alcohol dehydrogenase family)
MPFARRAFCASRFDEDAMAKGQKTKQTRKRRARGSVPHAEIRQGLDVAPSPKAERRAKGGPGPQLDQEWPGRESELRPRADHGEKSYVGAGKLLGRRALITGGDSGIGKAIAIAFAREGADVAFAYFDEHEDAADTVRWIERAGRKAVALSGDLTEAERCREVVAEAAGALSGLDILVNNVAYQCSQKDIREIDEAQLERTFRTNIMSFFWVTQAVLDHMREGSVIVNTGSVVALRGSAELLDYSATKGAIHVFTRSLADALAPRGIRVNCVAPGPVWTPLIPTTKGDDDVEEFGADTLWKRPAQPAELAPAFVFFASPDSRYVTGEILAVTGSATTR